MKKKILIASYNLDFGGIETSLINLLKNMDLEKYDVTLVLEEIKGDRSLFNALRADNQNHLMEKVGAEIRSKFIWNRDNRIIDRTRN